MAVRGKMRWTPVDALEQEWLDKGKDYIACPECKYFLVDRKPKGTGFVVEEFARQFADGRVHVTCPNCHALLGQKFWDRPTIGDRIRHACEFQISDMSWRARWVTSLVIAVGLAGGGTMLAYKDSNMSLFHYISSGKPLWGLLLGLIVFGFVWVFLSPGGGNYNYAWLWWFNNNRK